MPTTKLTCTKNVTVSSKYTSKSYRDSYLAFGRGSGGDEYRLLLDFTAVSDSIPSGVTVESATLVVPKTTGDIGSNAGFTAQACRITAAWTTSATWDSGNPSYTATSAATADTGTGHSGNVSFDVTAIVQAWVKGTATQRGILLRKSTSGGTYIKVAKELGAYINVTYAYKVSTFSTDEKATAGTSENITITADSAALTHDLTLTFGGGTWTLATGKTAAQLTSWTAPEAVCEQIPRAVSGSGKLTLTTYNGATKVGSTSKDVTISVPSSKVPTIGTLTATIAGSAVAAGWGLYVKNHSRVKLTLSSASGVLGSDIEAITFSGNGWSVGTTALTATSAVLTRSGNITFTATAKDSRGRTSAPKTITISVEDYEVPSISKASAVRADADGVAAGDGTYILVEASATKASVGGKNALTVTAAVSPGGWSGTLSGGKVLLGGGAVAVSKQYSVTITARDSLGGGDTRVLTVFTSTRTINISKDGSGVAVGGYAVSGKFSSFLIFAPEAGTETKILSSGSLDDALTERDYSFSSGTAGSIEGWNIPEVANLSVRVSGGTGNYAQEITTRAYGTKLHRRRLSDEAWNDLHISVVQPMIMASTPTELTLSTAYQQLAFTAYTRAGSSNMIAAQEGGVVCKIAGIVRIAAQANLSNLTDGDLCQLYVYRNGTAEGAWARSRCSGNAMQLNMSDWLQAVSAGDVITAHVRNSGSGGGTVASGFATRMLVEYVG